LRWLLIFLLACLLFNGLRGWLDRIGLGKLPGDVHFRWRGREFYLPFTSSLILSFVAMLIGLLV
jgi:hypothetical protein